MSITELASLLRKGADTIDANLPDILTRAAFDGVALIQERIQGEGVNADGVTHKPYSEGYLRFKQSPQSYKRGRALGLGSSRYTGKVDYTLTTEMWSDIKVIAQEFRTDRYALSIGPTKEINKDKLESLGKRDGQTLRLSREEKLRVEENIEIEIQELLKVVFE